MMRLAMQLGTRHVRQATSLARPAMASVQYGVQRHYRIENRIEDMRAASQDRTRP